VLREDFLFTINILQYVDCMSHIYVLSIYRIIKDVYMYIDIIYVLGIMNYLINKCI